MSLTIDSQSEYSQQHKQKVQVYQKKLQQALQKIQSHVKKLQEKVFSYGMSSSEYQQILQNSLSRVISKGKIMKYHTPGQFIKAVKIYMNKRPNRAHKLLTQIIRSIDEQVAELESSASEDDYSQNRRPCQTGLKLEQRQSQERDQENDIRVEFKHVSSCFEGTEPACIKLQSVLDEHAEPHATRSLPKRKKGRPQGSGRGKRKN